MANKTVTTGAVFVPEVWSGKTLDARESALMLAKRVERSDDEVKEFGDTIHFPVLPRYTARTKAANTAVTYESDTETEVVLTVDQHIYNGVTVESILKAQSKYNLINKYSKSIGNSLARGIDTKIAQQYANVVGGNVVASGSAATDQKIIDSLTLLDLADVPQEDRTFAFDPRFISGLRALAKFAEYQNTGEKALAVGGNNGLPYDIYGVATGMTTNLVKVAGTPNTVHNLLFHKEAIGLAMQKSVTMESQRDIDNIADKILGWTLFGVKVLRSDHIVDITLTY